MITLFFFIIGQYGVTSVFADMADNNSNPNLIASSSSVDQALQPSSASARVDQLNEIATLQEQNVVPAPVLPVAAQPQNIDTTMPVAIPQFYIVAKDGTSKVYTPTIDTLSFEDEFVKAQVIYLGNDQWKLQVTAKKEISQVYFPWQQNRQPLGENISEELYYLPFISGITEKVEHKNTDFVWGWSVDYPGSLFAPLVVTATDDKARVVAALNWPPKKVRPLYAAQRMTLLYEEEIKVGESSDFGALISEVQADLTKGEVPWQMALDHYREWLDPKMGEVEYPDWMWETHGIMNIQLENVYNFDAEKFKRLWDAYKEDFQWMQFWGQMGGYAGECCGLDYEMYSRYMPTITSLVNKIKLEGGYTGFYSTPFYDKGDPRSLLDTPEGVAWLEGWLTANEAYGANAHYIDTLGRTVYGDPAFIMELFKTMVRDNTLIEGAVDIYRSASLMSGALRGGFWQGDPGDTPENSDFTTFARFGRYLLNDRIMFMGASNDDTMFWGAKADYWSERQVFLLGMKFDAIMITEGLNSVDNRNPVMDGMIDERDRVNWWDRRPEYLDVKGLTGLPEGIEVRRFVDKDGKTLIVVENWNQIADKSFYVDGAKIFISTEKFSIIDMEKVMSKSAGDADGDGFVTAADYSIWADENGQVGVNSRADFNRDGKVDVLDYAIWSEHYNPPRTSRPGDANGDSIVDAADYTIWSDTYRQSGIGLAADFNNDGTVDGGDYTIWAANFAPPSADANADGKVDGGDITIYYDNLGRPNPNMAADFNKDGKVNTKDYEFWQKEYSKSTVPVLPAAALPTPPAPYVLPVSADGSGCEPVPAPAPIPTTNRPGDANGDGLVDSADYTIWSDTYNQSGKNLAADFNNDGTVDGGDYMVWAANYAPPLMPPSADANADGVVDGGDITVYYDNVGLSNPNMAADFNKDGKVNTKDYEFWHTESSRSTNTVVPAASASPQDTVMTVNPDPAKNDMPALTLASASTGAAKRLSNNSFSTYRPTKKSKFRWSDEE